jgi:hypothetical protein
LAVPLNDGGYGLGLAARTSKTAAILGYFFSNRFDTPPKLEDMAIPTHDEVILVVHFGNVGLMQGSWSVIGQMPGWRREDWPMPAFGRKQLGFGIGPDLYLRVRYDDDDPAAPLGETRISREEYERLPQDGAAGSGWIEDRLSELLAERDRQVGE